MWGRSVPENPIRAAERTASVSATPTSATWRAPAVHATRPVGVLDVVLGEGSQEPFDGLDGPGGRRSIEFAEDERATPQAYVGATRVLPFADGDAVQGTLGIDGEPIDGDPRPLSRADVGHSGGGGAGSMGTIPGGAGETGTTWVSPPSGMGVAMERMVPMRSMATAPPSGSMYAP